jgi:uncharacterized protein
MDDDKQMMLLRVYTDENAHIGDKRLVDELVRMARADGLAGATALRGRLGFGSRKGAVHQHHSLGVGDNMPMVVEIVDTEPAVRRFAAMLGDLHHIGLVTLERVEVLQGRSLNTERPA